MSHETKAAVLERLSREYKTFSKGQKRIADFILGGYDKAAIMTAADLAATTGVSESTIVRFAYSLGYAGYPEFHEELKRALQNRLTTVERLNMMEGLSSEEVIRASFRSDIDNLRFTENANTAELMDSVVDVLNGARRIFLLGTRSSWPLIQFVDYYLRYMMDNVTVIRFEGSDVYSQTLHASPDDVLLAISFPRYATATVEILGYMRDRGLPIVTITDSHSSPPARLSSFVLVAKSDMNSFVDSFVAPLALINALIIKLGLKRKNALFENFAELEKAWKEKGTYAAGILGTETDG